MTSLIVRPLSIVDAVDAVEEFFRDTPKFNEYTSSFQHSASIPSYPVSNVKIAHDGSAIFEVAVTGFSKSEVDVYVENNLLTIEANSEKEKEDETQYKYLYKRIAHRDFKVQYRIGSKMDIGGIESLMENGIISIFIPIK